MNADDLLVMLFNDITGGPIDATATIPEGSSIARSDGAGLLSPDGREAGAGVAALHCRFHRNEKR